jgi:FtsH-binding integral membrane protein
VTNIHLVPAPRGNCTSALLSAAMTGVERPLRNRGYDVVGVAGELSGVGREAREKVRPGMSGNVAVGPVSAAPEGARAAFIRQTYLHLAGAILACAAVAALLLRWPGARDLIGLMTRGYNWLFVLLLFFGASTLANNWARSATSVTTQYLGLGLFVVAQAIVLLPILFVAVNYSTPDVLPTAGLLTLFLFGGLTATAFFSGADFSFLRGALTIGGFLALGLIVVSILVGLNLGVWFAVALAVYAGAAILYQTSGIIRDYRTDQHVAAALGLFASVALLFWNILNIVQSRRI